MYSVHTLVTLLYRQDTIR